MLIALGLFFFDWRMALAALWVHPGILRHRGLCSYRVQDRVQSKTMAVKMACADGIQECIESDARSEGQQCGGRLSEGTGKENPRRGKAADRGGADRTAVFVTSAGMVLKLGIATVALVGSVLLMQRQHRCADVLHVPAGGIPPL